MASVADGGRARQRPLLRLATLDGQNVAPERSGDNSSRGTNSGGPTSVGAHDVIREHCAHLVRLNRRRGTVDQRRYALERLQRFIHHDPLAADLAELRAFVDRPLPGGGTHKAEYRAAETTHLVGFYRWAQREGLRLDDPTINLERPTRVKGHGRPMSKASLVRALTTAPSPTREWCYLGAYAGLRACEVAPLRGEDLWGGHLLVREGKGGKSRSVPVSDILATALRRMPATGIWFPHGWYPGASITAAQLDHRANRWLHDNDIPETFHQLRHWFGTMLRDRGVDLLVIRDLMGHASVATTEDYTKVGSNEGIAAIEKLPPPEAA